MIRNLTPHPVTILGEDGKVLLTLEPEGVIPRVREKHVAEGEVTVDGVAIPVSRINYEEVENLPAPKPGVYLVVSLLTAQAAPDRPDLLVPVGQVRDGQGRIVGCRGLGRLPNAPQATAAQAPTYTLVSTRINSDPCTLDNGIFVHGTDGTDLHLSPDPGYTADWQIESLGWKRVGQWEEHPPFSRSVEVVPLPGHRWARPASN